MMKHSIKISAIAVATVDGMRESNYERALRLTEIAIEGKPDVILLPEAFAAGYCGTNLLPHAETTESVHIDSFRKLSKRGDCLIVFGFLERSSDGIRNAVLLCDQGRDVGVHYKRSLWPDQKRPYRDEITLMKPGMEVEVFDTRFGRCAVLICYENLFEENWKAASRAEFILSPYNCEGDPAHNNIKWSPKIERPSAWACRTGTVYMGDQYGPNMGTAGMIDARGTVIAHSPAGIEQIVVGDLPV